MYTHLSLTHMFTQTLSLFFPHTRTGSAFCSASSLLHTHTHTHSLSLSHTHVQTALFAVQTLFCIHIHTLSLTLSHTHTHRQRFLQCKLSFAYTYTLSLSLSHTHTRTGSAICSAISRLSPAPTPASLLCAGRSLQHSALYVFYIANALVT